LATLHAIAHCLREEFIMTMYRVAALLLCSGLAACSNDTPPTNTAASTPTAATTSKSLDADTVVNLGVVFVDGDPSLMGGGELLRGEIKVGDRLEMWTVEGKRTGVRIDEIKDDASDEKVQSATAPASFFLTFTADEKGMASYEGMLVPPTAFADYAAARAFVDANAKPKGLEPTDQQRASRWGELLATFDDRAVRMPDPTVMLRSSSLSTVNLLDFVWTDEAGATRSPSKPSHIADAKREVQTIAADKPVSLSVSAGINDQDGEVLTIDVLLPLLPLNQYTQLPKTFQFNGAPKLLPDDALSVYARDGQQYWDATEATVTLTEFDAASGKFSGEFTARFKQRPQDLISGVYADAPVLNITSGRFTVDLTKY
jgi:hypothetical protein